jgi:WhiB family transcriptional regulator, redox-sensing transcriptional regulator
MTDQLATRDTTTGASPTSWMDLARCRDVAPQIFFPNDGAGVEVARRFCAECLVRVQCLEYALENHIQHGVWGGASERARRRIARKRKGNRAGRRAERPAEAATPRAD